MRVVPQQREVVYEVADLGGVFLSGSCVAPDGTVIVVLDPRLSDRGVLNMVLRAHWRHELPAPVALRPTGT